MEYMTVAEAAQKWGLTARRVRVLCAENRIDGVIRKGKLYMIPADAKKPDDARATKSTRAVLKRTLLEIEQQLADLSRRRPWTRGELERLRSEFLVEYTYNSNAIEGNTLTLKETAMVLEGVTIDQKPLKDHLE
ncbi:MAG: cell filamentation protein Fic, partial [Bacillota bacterium]|nr:cell filamentation protein Fic [Bacillota bacterium]